MPSLNDDQAKLTDYGLVTPTAGDTIGEPGQTLGGESALQQLLSAPMPNYNDQFKDRSTKIGALAGIGMGLLLNGPSGATEAIKGSLLGAMPGYGEDVENYNARAKAVAELLKNEQQTRNNIFALMGQKPEWFADVEGEALTKFLIPNAPPGLILSPAAMAKKEGIDKTRKDQFDATLKLLGAVPENQRGTRMALAAVAMNLIGINDPSGELYEGFWKSSGEISDEQLLSNFTNGVEMAAIRQRTGSVPWDIAVQKTDADEKFNPDAEAWTLLTKAQQFATAKELETGKAMPLLQAIDTHLTEAERLLVFKHFEDVYPGLTPREAMSAIQRQMSQMQMYAMLLYNNKALPQTAQEWDALMKRMANSNLTAASNIATRKNEADFVDAVEQRINLFLRQSAAMGKPVTLEEATSKAVSATVDEFRNTGRTGKIPQKLKTP